MTETATYATGKRKTAVARVWISPGSGQATVNRKPISEYFERETSVMIARQSLELLELADKYDVKAFVAGGGRTSRRGTRPVCRGRRASQGAQARRSPDPQQP